MLSSLPSSILLFALFRFASERIGFPTRKQQKKRFAAFENKSNRPSGSNNAPMPLQLASWSSLCNRSNKAVRSLECCCCSSCGSCSCCCSTATTTMSVSNNRDRVRKTERAAARERSNGLEKVRVLLLFSTPDARWMASKRV